MNNENKYKTKYIESLETIAKLENDFTMIKHKYEQLVIVYNKKNVSQKVVTNNVDMKQPAKKIVDMKQPAKKIVDMKQPAVKNVLKTTSMSHYERLKRKAIKKPYLFFADSRFFFLRPFKFFYKTYNQYSESGKSHVNRVNLFCAFFYNDFNYIDY